MGQCPSRPIRGYSWSIHPLITDYLVNKNGRTGGNTDSAISATPIPVTAAIAPPGWLILEASAAVTIAVDQIVYSTKAVVRTRRSPMLPAVWTR